MNAAHRANQSQSIDDTIVQYTRLHLDGICVSHQAKQPWNSTPKSRRTDMAKLALGILALSLTASVGLAEEMTVATPDAIKWA
jgi:hypothetical protein